MKSWKLEDAKNRFSQVVREALSVGPQLVTRNGRDAVVVVRADEYERLVAPTSLVDFFRNSPLAEVMAEGGLDLERDRDTGRDVVL